MVFVFWIATLLMVPWTVAWLVWFRPRMPWGSRLYCWYFGVACALPFAATGIIFREARMIPVVLVFIVLSLMFERLLGKSVDR